MAITVAELKVAISADTTRLDAAIREAPGRAASAMENAGKRIQSAGQGMASAGARLTVGVTAPLVAMGVQSLKAAGDFEQTMNVLAAGTRASSAQMEQARKLAIALGNDMKLPGTSATDAGKAMLALSQHDLKLNQVFAATRGVLQLSAAAHMDNAAAAKITASTLNAFRLEGGQAVRVADMLAAAHLSSGVAMGKLGFSVRNGAQAFAGAKIPLEDFMTSLALLAKNGLSGERAGTGLATALQKLLAPGAEGAKAIDALGLKFYTAEGRLKPWPKILDEIRGKMAGLSEADRNDTMKRLFGTGSSLSAAAILLKSGADGFEQMKKKLLESGVAARLAEAQMKGYKGAIDQFGSAINTAQITLTTRFLPGITALINRASELISRFAALPVSTQNLILGFAAVAAAAGPLLIGIGNLVTAFGAIMTVAGPVAAFLTGPVGLAIAGVAVVVAGLAASWRSNFGGIQEIVRGFWATIKPMFTGIIGDINRLAGPAMTFLRSAFVEIRPVIEPIWRGLWQVVGGIIQLALTGITLLVRGFINLLHGDWKGLWMVMIDAARSAWNALKNIFGGLGNFLTGFLRGLAKLFAEGGSQMIDGFVKAVKESVGRAVKVVEDFGRSVINTAKAVLAIASPSRKFHEMGEQTMDGYSNGIKAGAVRARGAVRKAMSDAEKEAQSFAGLMKTAMARLNEARAGGDAAAQRESATVSKLSAAHQAELKAINAKTRAINEQREATGRLQEFLAQTRATIRDLKAGGEFERFALKFQGADPGAIRSAFNESQSAEGLKARLDAEAEAAKDLKKELSDLALENLKLSALTKEEQVALEKFRVPFSQLSSDAQKAVTEFVKLRAEMEAFNKSVKENQKSKADALKALTSPAGDLVSAPGIPTIQGTFRQAIGTTRTNPVTGEIRGMATDFGEADPLETARKKARDGIRQIGQEWQAIVARSMENMKGGIGGFFSSVAKGIKDSIQQMLLELVKQKIFSQLFGAKAGAQTFGNNPLGAILGMAGGGPLGGILGGVLGGIKKIFRFADGGIPPIGVPSLVGERGPELFVPRSGGYVVPNHQLSGAAGGGGGVNVTFQNYGGIHKEADEHRVADRISREVHTALRMM